MSGDRTPNLRPTCTVSVCGRASIVVHTLPTTGEGFKREIAEGDKLSTVSGQTCEQSTKVHAK